MNMRNGWLLLTSAVLGFSFWAGCSQDSGKKDDGLSIGTRAPAFDVTDTQSGQAICYV